MSLETVDFPALAAELNCLVKNCLLKTGQLPNYQDRDEENLIWAKYGLRGHDIVLACAALNSLGLFCKSWEIR